MDSSSLACVNPSLHSKQALNLVNPNIQRAIRVQTFCLRVPKPINMLNMLSLQGATTTTPGRCVLGLFHCMSQVAPCRQGTLVRQHIPGIRLSSELIQSERYRMTRLIQTMQLFVCCEIIHMQDFFAELELLFGSHKPLILSVGRGQVKWNKLNDFDWPTAKLTAECQRLQCWFCSFLMRHCRWKREWTL